MRILIILVFVLCGCSEPEPPKEVFLEPVGDVNSMLASPDYYKDGKYYSIIPLTDGSYIHLESCFFRKPEPIEKTQEVEKTIPSVYID